MDDAFEAIKAAEEARDKAVEKLEGTKRGLNDMIHHLKQVKDRSEAAVHLSSDAGGDVVTNTLIPGAMEVGGQAVDMQAKCQKLIEACDAEIKRLVDPPR